MSKVLVTGFEPFAGSSLNPSQLIVQELSDEPNIVAAVLPVEYEAAARMLRSLASPGESYSAIVCLGQAEGRKAITFERLAVNLDDATLPDNGGEVRIDSEIDANGPSAIFTTLPVKQMVAAVRGVGVSAELSMSAGTFVCNHLFYRLQQLTASTNIAGGFIHVPLVTEQAEEFPGKPTMPLEEMVLGIKTALSVIG